MSTLVLSRKRGQSINIGDSITVTVNGVRNGQVSLAISAPRSVRVLRDELNKNAQPKGGCDNG